MFVVLNPPLGMKNASDRIFLNNKNILNVAISRAQDCLCILLPHRDTEGYSNLREINSIGAIAMKNNANVAVYTCDKIEEIIFGKKFFIENNTFVTSHQLTNVYTQASKRYEVRIDEKSIDIQLGYDSRNNKSPESKDNIDSGSTIINFSQLENKSTDKITEAPPVLEKYNAADTVSDPSKQYSNNEHNNTIDMYISQIDIMGTNRVLFRKLLKEFSPESSFVALQITGNAEFREKYGFKELSVEDIKYAFVDIKDNFVNCTFKNWVLYVLQHNHCPFKKMTDKLLSDISFDQYKGILTGYQNKPPKIKPRNKGNKRKTQYPYLTTDYTPSKKTDKLYETFEYGLSDW